MLENTSFEPETGKNRETCRQISVAHLQVFSGAPNSVAHQSYMRHRNMDFCGACQWCATEL